MLISKWNGTITLKELPLRKIRVGKNWVVQKLFLGATCRAQIFDCDIRGHSLIRTELSGPYQEILLRHKGTRRRDQQRASVTGVENTDHWSWPNHLELEWDRLGDLGTYADSPEKVRAAWVNEFDFREEDEVTNRPGLRTPQIGALHAISAHFAVGKEFEAATVVLPTGTGKTETMLASQVYRRHGTTLVLVPSDTLRSQVSGKFITLGVLPDASVVKPEIARPRVAVIATGIRSREEAEKLIAESNVIVALPNVLEASNKDVVAELIQGCTDLVVDEAHHVTASTWNSIRELFKFKRILQFTATPFRRDGKRIDGKIIFNYKLGDAQEAGYYRPINLKTIEDYGDDEARDRAIASAAIHALRHDRDTLGLDHLLMARTRNKERAEAVATIYRELASDFRPVVVFSGPGRAAENKKALSQLLDRGPDGARIVICVDMLGEGFDLPNLKVAALHDTHKSLAITLQFVGRFTRKGAKDKIGEATVIANLADRMTENKLAALYAEGADWDQLIKRLSEERIATELRLQEVVYGLKENGDLAAALSLWNLRPALSAQFFRTTCTSWSPLEFNSVLPKDAESWYAYNETENVLVAVICRETEVSWGNYQNVFDTIYDLLIIRWDKKSGVLCLYASDYNGLRSDKLAAVVTDDNTSLVSGTPIFNILNNVELPLVKSLGSSRVGAISFTSYFGPNVTDGLANIEKAEAELNNIACLGYEAGERVLWGGTQRRGKIWQARNGSIAEWIEWTARTWAKVTSDGQSESNITRDFLRPRKLDAAYQIPPIAAQWGEQAQIRLGDRQGIAFGTIEAPLIMVDLDIASVSDNDRSILLRIAADGTSSEYRLTISKDLPGGYQHEHVSGPKLRFRKGKDDAVPLEEYLQKDPVIIRYADGTYSYNCYHIDTNISGGSLDRSHLESWDWTGIPLNNESMGKERNELTIQYRTFERLRDEFDLVFNDDGAGECADLVCLKDIDDSTIKLCLVHCKGAYGGAISQDIRNFYVVCGQAQKNINARHKGLPHLYRDLRRRQEAWMKVGATRFLKGDMKILAFFAEKARRSKLKFEVILVQPGASAQTITDNSLRLLATTELYLTKTTEAAVRFVISP